VVIAKDPTIGGTNRLVDADALCQETGFMSRSAPLPRFPAGNFGLMCNDVRVEKFTKNDCGNNDEACSYRRTQLTEFRQQPHSRIHTHLHEFS
jgi:hypothetical protein